MGIAKSSSRRRFGRWALYLLAIVSTVLYWKAARSLIKHHEEAHRSTDTSTSTSDEYPLNNKLHHKKLFETKAGIGSIRSNYVHPTPPPKKTPAAEEQNEFGRHIEGKLNPAIRQKQLQQTKLHHHPTGECAINLFGLPRSFGDHVLPSLVHNVIPINSDYECDYFVHFFNVTEEESQNTRKVAGGKIQSSSVYNLENAVKKLSPNSSVYFVSDTDEDFLKERKLHIDEIMHGFLVQNPYEINEPSFTKQTLWNILKMWHSQDKVWNLMEKANDVEFKRLGKKIYKRVAMLRLDVIYTVPIDIYKYPKEIIPDDLNDAYQSSLHGFQRDVPPAEYFYDFDSSKQLQHHGVVPGFKSFPVNDRYFVGPYAATKIWAKDRFARARKHVTEVLPVLDAHEVYNDDEVQKFSEMGLHDETFVAYTILPAIRQAVPDIELNVDRELYFVRVRADGSIWLKDKMGFGKVKKKTLEQALGRTCKGEPYEVIDPILQDKSPGRWQIKCPPSKTDEMILTKLYN